MKHRRSYRISSDDDGKPEVVARQVRAIIADFLGTVRLRFDPAPLLDRVERLAALIAFWGTRINLTAAPTDSCELAFHILDSLAPIICCYGLLHQEFDPHSRLLDLGSGAGFPGLVLASASPAQFTLIESRRKRANFLSVAVAEMGLKNVSVEQRLAIKPQSSFAISREQAPDLLAPPLSSANMTNFRRAAFNAVTGRAFAPASGFHSAAAPILQRGGVAIFYANPGQDLAQRESEKAALCDFRAVSYTIPRRSHLVERVLGLWWRS